LKIYIWTLFFTICLISLGCKESSQRTKVALIIPLSGALAPWGKSCEQAVTLGLKQKNKALQLVVFDNQGNITKTKQIFEGLINDKQILAVIGPLKCSCLEGILSLIKKNHIPVISPGCFQEFPQSDGWVVPILKTQDEAKEMALFLNKNHLSWAIFWENISWAEALSRYLRKMVHIKPEFSYSLNTQNSNHISYMLSNLKKKKPQLIVSITTPVTGALIISQIKDIGLDPYFLGPFCFLDPEFKKIVYGISDKILIATPTIPQKLENEFNRQFLTHYYLSPNWIATSAYAAIKAIATSPNLNRKGVKKHLRKTKFLQFKLKPLNQQ